MVGRPKRAGVRMPLLLLVVIPVIVSNLSEPRIPPARFSGSVKIESNATKGVDRLYTSVDLEKLVSNLSITKKSDNAGKFVCEGLYYQVLKHLQKFQPHSKCIFIHVPVLTDNNCQQIITDFNSILKNL